MAIHYRTRGFVIKKRDIGEADRIFTVLTQDFGKIKISGKAIRKIASKLRGGIDIFYLSEIEFIQGKSYKTLTDTIVLEKFENIKRDLNKFKIVHKIAELLDNLLGVEEKDDKLWDLLVEVFEKLNDYSLSVTHYSLIYYYFLWNFFSILGYKPELFRCAICQKKLSPDAVYFSSDDGGIICSSCKNEAKKSKKINSDFVKVLRLILKKDWQILFKLKIQPFLQKLLKEISEDYYSHLLSIHSSLPR